MNGVEYQGVQDTFVDSISRRLSVKLLQQRTNRVDVDQHLVVTELQRMYGSGLQQKEWFKDFVMQFCKDRRIPCRKENL